MSIAFLISTQGLLQYSKLCGKYFLVPACTGWVCEIYFQKKEK